MDKRKLKWKRFYFNSIRMKKELWILFGIYILLLLAGMVTGGYAICAAVFLYAIFFSVLLCLYHHTWRWQKLNSFFVAKRLPFGKWRCIYQQVDEKNKIGLLMACNLRKKPYCQEFYRYLRICVCNMFWNGLKKGYYRTVTHEIIARRIRYMEEIGKLKILEMTEAYSYDLLHTQNQLLDSRCVHCRKKEVCRYYRSSEQTTQFYFIRFQVLARFDGRRRHTNPKPPQKRKLFFIDKSKSKEGDEF